MELTGDVKDIFENVMCHQMATSSLDGVVNISNIGAKYLREDGAIVVVDNYMKKTKDNVIANPRVAILVRREKLSFQIKGTCRYVDEGPEYEAARSWMKAKAEKYPAKGALIITSEAVYDSTTGPCAGELVS